MSVLLFDCGEPLVNFVIYLKVSWNITVEMIKYFYTFTSFKIL